ncbi:MAG: purine-nucleoside phosphorylase [Alphaproteobacteria bacterium]|nr:MAG: purine-nucleoside phosphorylase [Alphaproteobacteria bacterium]
MAIYHDCADHIREKLAGAPPKRAFILGSGLGDLADSIEVEAEFSYGDLPGFPVPTVEGHAGRMVIGALNGARVICLQGRAHLYEGHPVELVTNIVRTLSCLGVEELIITNAAGSMNVEAVPGSLMLITDHINYTGINPLIGANDDDFGPRFPDMTHAYHPDVQAALRSAAASCDVTLHEGVYLWVTGPSFETPAEIRAFIAMGATAVGMSTVPECIVAVHAGMKVGCISTITNLAAGMSAVPLTHEETLSEAAKGAQDLKQILMHYVVAHPI